MFPADAGMNRSSTRFHAYINSVPPEALPSPQPILTRALDAPSDPVRPIARPLHVEAAFEDDNNARLCRTNEQNKNTIARQTRRSAPALAAATPGR